jgi:hypothetical protein
MTNLHIANSPEETTDTLESKQFSAAALQRAFGCEEIAADDKLGTV